MVSGLSETAIFNMALIHLGDGTILSPQDDNKTTKLCGIRYPSLRDTLQRSYKWNFCTRRAVLAASISAPLFGFAYQYKMPTDCLRVFELVDDPQAVFTVEGSLILTDLPPPLRIRYCKRELNPGNFDPIFGEVLAVDLAMSIAMAVVGKQANRSNLASIRQSFMDQAIMADMDEAVEVDFAETGWMEARRS